MPIFECSRCDELTYSATRANAAPCPTCGAARRRLVADAATFAEAREVPRAVSHGAHSIVVFDDYDQVAGVATQFVDQARLAGGLIVAAVPQPLEDVILARLHPDDRHGIAWEPPSDTYGPTFGPDQVIARLREIAELEHRPVFILGCADEPIQHFTSIEGWTEYERRAHELAVEYGITALCLYDARLHDERMLRAGLAMHRLDAPLGEAAFRRDEEFDYEPPAA
jgi:hypothetical protein